MYISYINLCYKILCLEESSPPINFKIININTTSFQLMWSSPTNPHGEINKYAVSTVKKYVYD